jgi:hypothetical protein
MAAVEAQQPVAVIQNLTQEVVQRIDRTTGDVAACLGATGTITCLANLVGHNWQM